MSQSYSFVIVSNGQHHLHKTTYDTNSRNQFEHSMNNLNLWPFFNTHSNGFIKWPIKISFLVWRANQAITSSFSRMGLRLWCFLTLITSFGMKRIGLVMVYLEKCADVIFFVANFMQWHGPSVGQRRIIDAIYTIWKKCTIRKVD